ncbi:dihydrofolate reductase family protein [Actinoalloteichus spitiensis]|uniref:dihydrofolate reductase family protein n=1 Tax=Actinoalloteichus spitiensis TaxID=252394 RepID=UPI00030C0D44|nr:dihydrofolate reductase family protein [Actinoalloteichus spitiensis]
MRKVIYSLSVSLDGYIQTTDGQIDWSAPDPELHQFHNAQEAETDTHLYGRRLYEEMASHWPTAATHPDATREVIEYARIWRDTPKIVFSRTLDSVEHNSTLVRDDIPGTIQDLRDRPGKHLSLGGATLAASFHRLGLIDEYRLFVHPVVLGDGTPYFPTHDHRTALRLTDSHVFGSGVVYLRYQPA